MPPRRRVVWLFLLAGLLASPAFPQETQSAAPQAQHTQAASTTAQELTGQIYLDVVVTPKSGGPVGGLQQQNFTVLDNKSPRPITSFVAMTGREAPIEIVLVVDAINATHQNVTYEQQQLDQLLRAEGGHLAHPMAIALATEDGVKIVGNFSLDGNALSADLDKEDIGLRAIDRHAGYNGATERWQDSIRALRQLLASMATMHHSRRVIVWISPGWPLLPGLSTQITEKQQQQLFGTIVGLSTQIQQARVTLYSMDPFTDAVIAKEYFKGVSKPSQADVGYLGLPALAFSSGGLTFNFSNDIVGTVQKCLSDITPYYQITFEAAKGDHADEYHQIEVRVDQPGLMARTLQGYYAKPSSQLARQ
jgi:VWFA-related protein